MSAECIAEGVFADDRRWRGAPITMRGGKKIGGLSRPAGLRKGRPAVAGDLAWLRLEDGQDVPTVVVRAYPGRVELADCSRDEWLRKISDEYAALIELTQEVPA